MTKLDLQTPDFVAANAARLAELFPHCVTETQLADGTLKRAIDFDLLRQELSRDLVEGPQERYRLDWPGKREALALANEPIRKTLRPAREESVDFDTTQNLYIEGDNLDALKLLQETYLGKVKMIYIDPPYNTGQDFIYDDNFSISGEEHDLLSGTRDEEGNAMFQEEKWKQNSSASGRFHSEWLSMMYPRLKLARNLLRDDGVIFISIDSGESVNLRKICDEVFGADGFLEELIWKNKYNAGALTKGFSNVHEYILAYSKGGVSNIAAPLSDEQKENYDKRDEKFSIRGGYLTQPLATISKDPRPNLVFPIIHEGAEIWPDKQWIWSRERVEEAYRNNELVIKKNEEKYSVRVKQYLRDEAGNERLTKPLSIFVGPFNQEGTKEISSLIGRAVFGFPKPSSLVSRLSMMTRKKTASISTSSLAPRALRMRSCSSTLKTVAHAGTSWSRSRSPATRRVMPSRPASKPSPRSARNASAAPGRRFWKSGRPSKSRSSPSKATSWIHHQQSPIHHLPRTSASASSRSTARTWQKSITSLTS
jgi:adenine-specific DNA-methyltransferase